MQLKKLIYLLILIFSLPTYSEDKNYDFPSLSSFLEKEVKKGRYPGFFTYIKKNGNLIYSEVVGFNDVKNKTCLLYTSPSPRDH